MTFNAKCWTLPRFALGIAVILLTGCATGVSDRRGGTCPPVVEYTPTEQARTANQIEALSDDAAIIGLLSDYAVMRAQARACR
ncbi:hypothetical protein [Cypionkella sp. TWP1-2-1b2]|uniref:hypothetical protein n=1 Tax=Cypionkella sp. TWP1-2-1b2 TaxID=2804675 RepID=UPI003CF64FDF